MVTAVVPVIGVGWAGVQGGASLRFGGVAVSHGW